MTLTPAKSPLKITRALLSVSDKTGIVPLAQKLESLGVHLLSTGGTAKLLAESGIKVTEVSDHTGFPEIMEGRVKTLHPKIHGGLLAKKDDPSHVKAMDDHAIAPIDMLVVNLYPFVETLLSNADFDTCIENIDIGGPAMIRASAKNHAYVAVVTDPRDYDKVMSDMTNLDGCVSYDLRQKLAFDAFSKTAAYDSSISTWLAEQVKDNAPRHVTFSGELKQTLRYGENPHQNAALYITRNAPRAGAATASQIQGKELSYNNLNDTNAAFELVAEFDQPAVAIIKHANPCGVAVSDTTLSAYKKALLCDPVSAFGGIIALNRPLTRDLATAITERFVEVIIAPEVQDDCLEILAKKSNIRVLKTGGMPNIHEKRKMVTCIAGGLLVQDMDNALLIENDLQVVTHRHPTDQELNDLLFSFRVAKHVKSNAIVYAKNGATVGIGAGQMSRIDSSRIAAWKADEAAKASGFDETLARGSVVASDAFFPFADGLIAAADAGVTAIIQPGGSIRDQEVIDAANERGLAMIFTGMRHFRH